MIKFRNLISFLFFTLFLSEGFCQITIPTNEEEQIKLAEKLYQEEDYGQAFKLYSTLLAHYPKDPKFNYRIGVCILNVGDDKGDRKPAIHYLEIAKNKFNELDKEVLFYLGRAYHVNYDFDDAILYYNEYKAIASINNSKKLKIDHQIQTARNGKYNLSKFPNVVVLEKKRMNSNDYFRSYQSDLQGGNLIVKPEEFALPADKKRKDKFILHQSIDKKTVVFSSYGDKGENGKDIYMAKRQSNGEFGKPFLLSKTINTEYDEDYPFLHPNGKTLYFCSKGHNSMGGYDIFKSQWNEVNQNWDKPENMQFPINTPADDIQFICDSTDKIAIFSSTRISENGKIDVYKIDIEKRPAGMGIVKGEILKNEEIKGQSSLTVKDLSTGETYGPFKTDESGKYKFEVPNGRSYLFTVEAQGITTQSESVNIPVTSDNTPLKQIISYENKKLIIKNFVGDTDENNYREIKDIIMEKMKMNVNKDEKAYSKNNITTSDDTLANKKENKLNDENVNENKKLNQEKNSKNINNSELLKMAESDLKELEKETEDLNQQLKNTEKMVFSLKETMNKKTQEIDSLKTKINNQSEQKTEIETKIKNKETELSELTDLYTKATNITNDIKFDYQNKIEEKKLQQKLVNVMNEAIKNPKNKEKEKSLLDTETELLKHQEKYKELKHDDIIDLTRNELEQSEKILNNYTEERKKVEEEQNILDNEIAEKKQELEKEKDKDIKESIVAEIENLASEKKDINRNLEDIDKKINLQNKEIDKLKSQNDFVSNMIYKSKTGNDLNLTLNKSNGNVSNINENNVNFNNTNESKINKDSETLKRINTLKTNQAFLSEEINEYNIKEKKTILLELKELTGRILSTTNNSNTTQFEKELEKINTTLKNIEEYENNQKKLNASLSPNEVLKKTDSISNVSILELINYSKKEENFIAEIIPDAEINSDTAIAGKNIKNYNGYIKLLDTIIIALKDSLKMTKNKKQKEYFKNKLKEKEITRQKNINSRTFCESVIAASNQASNSQKTTNKIASYPQDTISNNSSSAYNFNTFSNEKASEKRNTSIHTLNNIYLEEILIQKRINDIEKANENFKFKEDSNMILNEAKLLKDSANKLRLDLKSSPLESRKSMIQQAESLEIQSEQKILDISNTKINILKRKIEENKIFINSIKQTTPDSELFRVLSNNNTHREIDELLNSMNSYESESKTKKTFENQDELLTMSIESGEAILEKQQAIIDKIYNKALKNNSKLASVNLDKSEINNILEKNQAGKLNAMNAILEAHDIEYKTVKEKVKAIEKKTGKKNNPEIISWMEKSNQLMKETEQLKKEKSKTNDVIKKITLSDSILKKQEMALFLLNKSILSYKNGDVEKFEEKYSQYLANQNQTKLSQGQVLNSSNNLIRLDTMISSNKSIDSSEPVKDTTTVNPLIVNMNNAKKDSLNVNNLDEKTDPKNENKSSNSTDSRKDSTINELLASRIKQDSIMQYEAQQNSNKIIKDSTENKIDATNENLNSTSNRTIINTKSNQNNQSQDSSNTNNSVTINGKNKNEENNTFKNDNSTTNTIKVNKQTAINENNFKNNDTLENTLNVNTNNKNISASTNNEQNASKSITINSNGLKVNPSDAYSETKPIPIDEKFPSGIVFTVQVGAFRNPVPNSTFKGLNPVNGTKTQNGFIRYQAGLFTLFKEANAAKNDLKKLGFKDAFVAVYKNNQRISLNEALKELNIPDVNEENTSTGIISSGNLPDGNLITQENLNKESQIAVSYTSIEKISGFFYTVQIGLYSSNPGSEKLLYLQPIQREPYNNNKFRYMAGVYNKLEKIRIDIAKVRALGISDAFICAYKDGKRVKVDEIKNKEKDSTVIFEKERPIIFNSELNRTNKITQIDTSSKKIIQPENQLNSSEVFSNGITKDPEPTPENGVKLTNEGITFKIQIGAYSKSVPKSISENWLKIKNWPVKNYTNTVNLIIYTVGSFSEFVFAKKLLLEIKELGVQDAFITVFKDGKRLYGEEATRYTR